MPSLSVLRRLTPALLALLVATPLVLAASPASARPTPALTGAAAPAVAVEPSLTATIRLNNCSASLVRYPTSRDTDRAMMLTNGHCFEGGFLAAGQVIQNRASTRRGTLLNAAGSGVAAVTADRLLYATMTGTDVALYRLNRSFTSIRSATGLSALTIAAAHPAAGDTFVPSGFFSRIFDCDVQGFVPTLREHLWTWHDSLRYANGCGTIGGTSGSPIVNVATGEIVGVNNTANEDGRLCTLNNPCEVAPDGTPSATRGVRYGQQTFLFNTCLTPGRQINLNLDGCLLTKPAR
jgi:hypothetical protein